MRSPIVGATASVPTTGSRLNPRPRRRAAPPHEMQIRGTQRAASVQLARVEGRQLLRNEAFLVGIFMSIAILVIFGLVWASDSLGRAELMAVLAGPAARVLSAVRRDDVGGDEPRRAARQARRDRGAVRFTPCLSHDSSSSGISVPCGWRWSSRSCSSRQRLRAAVPDRPLRRDRRGRASVTSSVSFVLVVCAGSLAVALARWLPNPLAALGSLVVLAFVGSVIGGYWRPPLEPHPSIVDLAALPRS